MTPEAITVFGLSRGEYAKRGFAFADVVATIDGTAINTIDNAKEQFPTEGTIFVDKGHWIPERGVGAIWKVQERAGPEGQRWAAFCAVGRGRAGPSEIIPIAASVSRPEAIRRLLVSGIPLNYSPGTSILVRTSEGVHLGPIRCDHFDQVGKTGILVRAEALVEPLGRWDRPAELRPFATTWQGQNRSFTSLLSIPEPSAFLDCSDVTDCVRAVLKYAASIKVDGFDLTKKQLDVLTTALGSEGTPKRMAARVSRVIEALQLALSTKEDLQVVTDFLLARPDVQATLARVIEEARAEEERRITSAETAAKERIKTLGSREREIRDRLSELERQMTTAARKAEGVIDDMVGAFRRRIADIEKDPADAFTGAALLRSVLLSTPGVVALDVVQDDSDETKPRNLATTSEILGQLVSSVRSVGLTVGSAHALAREVLAAALAGQVTTFVGSMASLTAAAAARTFAGSRVLSISVPVGLLGSKDFSRCLQEAVRASRDANSVSALLIQGINRSAVDVFSERLVALVAERQVAASNPAPSLIVFATAVSGAASLPLPELLCDLGPVFDTDVLVLGSTKTESPAKTEVSTKTWIDLLNTSELTEDVSSAIDLSRPIGTGISALGRKVLQSAYARLTAVRDNAQPTPLQSLAFGWLLPRAQIRELPREKLPLEFISGKLDGSDIDKRVAQLASRLTSGDDGANGQ